jgi:transcriptional regulator with XRE-family HTH domain
VAFSRSLASVYIDRIGGILAMTKADEGMIDAAIGARIRGLRLQNGLTQQFLANELDVSFQQIQKYERGVNQLSPTRLLRLAAIFGVSTAVLLGEKSKTSSNRLPELLIADLDKPAIKMYEAYQKLKDRRLRKQISALVQGIAASQ